MHHCRTLFNVLKSWNLMRICNKTLFLKSIIAQRENNRKYLLHSFIAGKKSIEMILHDD